MSASSHSISVSYETYSPKTQGGIAWHIKEVQFILELEIRDLSRGLGLLCVWPLLSEWALFCGPTGDLSCSLQGFPVHPKRTGLSISIWLSRFSSEHLLKAQIPMPLPSIWVQPELSQHQSPPNTLCHWCWPWGACVLWLGLCPHVFMFLGFLVFFTSSFFLSKCHVQWPSRNQLPERSYCVYMLLLFLRYFLRHSLAVP